MSDSIPGEALPLIVGESPLGALVRAGFLQELRLRWKQAGERAARHDSGPLTSIVILTHNQRWCTEMCLASIRLFTEAPYELLVVDNASTDDTLDYLRRQSDVRLFANPINRGFPAGCNLGLHHVRGEYLLLLNNDVIVTPGWLEKLQGPLIRDPQVGLVGPVSNNVSGPQCILTSFRNVSEVCGQPRTRPAESAARPRRRRDKVTLRVQHDSAAAPGNLAT